MEWERALQETLDHPYSEWLQKSRLTKKSDNGTCFLVVDEKTLGLSQDIFIAVNLLKAARLVDPELRRVIPVSGSIYEHIIESSIEISKVEIDKDRINSG